MIKRDIQGDPLFSRNTQNIWYSDLFKALKSHSMFMRLSRITVSNYY